MQDQVINLKDKNINAVYLASAQLDKKAEYGAFLSHSEYCIARMFGGGSLTNLTKEHNFVKLKPSKRHMHVIYGTAQV